MQVFVKNVVESYIIFLFFEGLLLFSLLKSGAKSRKKAKAVLIITLASALIWIDYYLIYVNRLPMSMALIVPAVLLALGIMFRSTVFPFRTHCVNCGKALSISEFLSMDEHLCASCYQEIHPESVKLSPDEQYRRETEEKKKDWQGWKPDREYVLVFAFDEKSNVLLIDNLNMPKSPGKHSGVIGAVNARSDKYKTASNALKRETGIVCERPDYMGRLNFQMPDTNVRFYIFIAREFSGTLKEGGSKKPIWVSLKKLDYDLMSMDYPLWLPRMLRGQYVEYYAKVNPEGKIYEDILDLDAKN
ncbi:MAG: hypothetical protein Q4D46_09240 [Erysipelotrichaceae bacterium]|nr:hypothetical protein [Erysipelotrichaceae bacterium]